MGEVGEAGEVRRGMKGMGRLGRCREGGLTMESQSATSSSRRIGLYGKNGYPERPAVLSAAAASS